MNKDLTIIVPFYNTEKDIERCLKSLINQNYDNYQIFLINDGSTDKSLEICMKYKNEYPEKIKIFNKENGGQASARNLGITKCKSKYLWFVDSDDYIKENCIQEIMHKIGNNDILVFNLIAFNSNMNCKINAFIDENNDSKKKYLISNPSPCNKIIKSSLLKDNEIFFPEGIYYEDFALIPSLVQYAKSIVFDNNYYYFYYQRPGSTMHQEIYNPKLEDIFTAINILSDSFSTYEKRKYKQEFEYIYILHLLKNASLRFLDFKKYKQVDNIRNIIKENYPKWRNNIYYKKYEFKYKIMCNLIMLRFYKLIEILRSRRSNL